MKISIITPTHDAQYLSELERTIMSQTHRDWEWIILLNNGASFDCAQEPDQRIKIVDCPFTNNSVGFLKRLACMQATGDVIAEVDHDDLLTDDCLEKLAAAFEDDETGFVFSRNAKLSNDFRPYLEEYGWKHSFFFWRGKRLYAMHNQPVYPGRLGDIYFAPDHIRAWRRDVYEKIGGHNDSLKVCDDLDLMHRLYMETKFKEIEEVLYVYRINGNNTFIKNGEMIRQLNDRLYHNNIEGLCRRFAEVNGLDVIDLPSAALGDRPSLPSTAPSAALRDRKDNSVGLIKAVDVLQYVEDARGFMGEVHRVLAPGGMILTMTPSTDGRAGFQDPGVKSFWNENSFWYYTRENYARRAGVKGLFRSCRVETIYRDEEEKMDRMSYVRGDLEKI
jgi:glycosyltransferase involved in cell wall biosynthesis